MDPVSWTELSGVNPDSPDHFSASRDHSGRVRNDGHDAERFVSGTGPAARYIQLYLDVRLTQPEHPESPDGRHGSGHQNHRRYHVERSFSPRWKPRLEKVEGQINIYRAPLMTRIAVTMKATHSCLVTRPRVVFLSKEQ